MQRSRLALVLAVFLAVAGCALAPRPAEIPQPPLVVVTAPALAPPVAMLPPAAIPIEPPVRSYTNPLASVLLPPNDRAERQLRPRVPELGHFAFRRWPGLSVSVQFTYHMVDSRGTLVYRLPDWATVRNQIQSDHAGSYQHVELLLPKPPARDSLHSSEFTYIFRLQAFAGGDYLGCVTGRSVRLPRPGEPGFRNIFDMWSPHGWELSLSPGDFSPSVSRQECETAELLR